MNFLKQFIMEHPLISLIIGVGLLNRAEDAYYMHQAAKNGTEYHGHRWQYTSKKSESTANAAMEDDGK